MPTGLKGNDLCYSSLKDVGISCGLMIVTIQILEASIKYFILFGQLDDKDLLLLKNLYNDKQLLQDLDSARMNLFKNVFIRSR